MRKNDRSANTQGIEGLLDSFLTELLSNPIQFEYPVKEGYVPESYYLKKFDLKTLDLNEVMDVLSFDRYVHLLKRTRTEGETTANDAIELSINLRGTMFLEAGGYTTQKADMLAERSRISNLETSNYHVTFWVAVGTVGLLILEIVKFFIDHTFCKM